MVIYLLSILAVLTTIFVPQTHAQSSPIGQGITITPSIARIDLAEDAPEVTLYYHNNTALPVELSFKAQDFTALEEGWKPKFLEEKDAANYQYALSSWITFEKQQLALNPNERGTVRVFINHERLTPGGHYATILAELVQKDDIGQVKLKGILSSLLFVRTSTGLEVEKAEIAAFKALISRFSWPNAMLLRFHNTGNVDVVPHGLITLSDSFGKEVGKGIVNEDSLITLPESIRRYDVPVKTNRNVLLPGKYTATVNIQFGKSSQQLTTQTTFYSLGSLSLWHIATGAVLLAIAGIGIKKYRKRRVKKHV